ncbi:hypothetical protein QYE76_030323 [Lolium multiflorum]|uniref:Uncharacterized protein n=1 Tax=Lolium multiflorum TaxID=4521 RepID=A0AAD8VJ56_LOLMU|nr:hypothetical protein QYE76_030323 [Lolium multiflorum]
MENYSLLMGAAAVMKMAVEMAAVSMEKPSGGTSPLRRVPEQRLLSPDLGLAMAAAGRFRGFVEPHEIIVLRYMGEMNHIATGTARSLDGELLLLMGAAVVMKMAVEMAAVSMEKPSGALPRSGGVPEQRLLSPRSWPRDGGGSEDNINNVAWNIRNYRYVGDVSLGDINNSHGGGGAAAGATFPAAMYVIFLSYLALLLVPCSDLMHVLSLMQFSPSGFAVALKPSPFTGSHFKRWQNKTLLWLTSMGVHRVAEGTPRGPLTPEDDKAFGDATVICVGAVLSVLADKLVDAYLHIRNGKELWDALDAKFGAADAGGELYAMEQFNDYRMVENRSVVEQAHEIQIMAKELELLKCVLPDKFVAGCIVAKLPPS